MWSSGEKAQCVFVARPTLADATAQHPLGARGGFYLPVRRHPSPIARTRRSGFTLIEVLVALAIVGALLGTLLYTLQLHMSVATDARDLAEATSLAHEILERKQLDGIRVAATEDKELDNGFAYHYEVVDAEILDGLYEVRLVLTGHGQEIRLNAFAPK